VSTILTLEILMDWNKAVKVVPDVENDEPTKPSKSLDMTDTFPPAAQV